jgi:hypothetical protein
VNQLSVSIQHHPSRSDLLHRTQHLGGEIVCDPDPNGARNPWRTYRECLYRTPRDATHRLVLQDDAIVCDHFLEAMQLVLEVRPDNMLALFVPGSHRIAALEMLQACDRDECFFPFPFGSGSWIPVVALVWPSNVIPEFLEWADTKYPVVKRRADDAIVGQFARERQKVVLATVPSLVDHPDDVPSLIGNRINERSRQAVCMVDGDARERGWR